MRTAPVPGSVLGRRRGGAGARGTVTVRPVRTILDRFRRGAGVPAVVGDELVAELAPVFAAIDEAEAEAERIRAAARRRVELRLAAARERTARLEAEASRRAQVERERTVASRRRDAEAEQRALLQAAADETARIREQSRQRIPALVDGVLACIQEAPR